jgi:hypothetical protein
MSPCETAQRVLSTLLPKSRGNACFRKLRRSIVTPPAESISIALRCLPEHLSHTIQPFLVARTSLRKHRAVEVHNREGYVPVLSKFVLMYCDANHCQALPPVVPTSVGISLRVMQEQASSVQVPSALFLKQLTYLFLATACGKHTSSIVSKVVWSRKVLSTSHNDRLASEYTNLAMGWGHCFSKNYWRTYEECTLLLIRWL